MTKKQKKAKPTGDPRFGNCTQVTAVQDKPPNHCSILAYSHTCSYYASTHLRVRLCIGKLLKRQGGEGTAKDKHPISWEKEYAMLLHASYKETNWMHKLSRWEPFSSPAVDKKTSNSNCNRNDKTRQKLLKSTQTSQAAWRRQMVIFNTSNLLSSAWRLMIFMTDKACNNNMPRWKVAIYVM